MNNNTQHVTTYHWLLLILGFVLVSNWATPSEAAHILDILV